MEFARPAAEFGTLGTQTASSDAAIRPPKSTLCRKVADTRVRNCGIWGMALALTAAEDATPHAGAPAGRTKHPRSARGHADLLQKTEAGSQLLPGVRDKGKAGESR